MSHRYDGSASRGGYGSPPPAYRGQAEPSSQPYSNRPMPPPPSSPNSRHRYYQSFPPPLPRDSQASPAPTTLTGRELPAPTSSARPGSSMSISSMLGSDTAAPHHTTPPSQTSTPVQPQAKGPIGSFRSDYAPYRRAKTPDGYPPSDRSAPREYMGHSTGTSPSTYPPNRNSPDQQRQATQSMYPYSHQSPYSASTALDRLDQMRQPYPDRNPLPPRPNSQPTGQAPLPPGRDASQYTSYPQSQDRPDLAGRFDRRDTLEDRERAIEIERHRAELDRERELMRTSQRPSGVSGGSQSYYKVPPYDQRDANREPQWRQPVPYQSTSNSQTQEHTSHLPASIMTSGPPIHHTPSGSISNSPTYPRSNGNAQDSPGVHQTLAPYPHDSRRDGRQHEHQTFGPSLEELQMMQRKGSEDSQRIQKGLLSVSPDITRKTGRISPLPQAVHGVQGQLHGPGREPGIKSEFGRMFSGIGSGVGSGLASPAPPSEQEQSRSTSQQVYRQDSEMVNLDAASQEMDSRLNKSKPGATKVSRRFPDDESRMESESGDGRGGSSVNGRGTKRSKHAHHHHHHPPGHRHHHHHHKADDETLSTPNSSSPAFSSFSANKRIQSPGQGNSNSATPSGHHHHHHHHHHHAKPTSNPVPIPQPVRKPIITIRSSSVIGSVARLPRTHLGSTQYTPRLSVASSPYHNRFGFVSSPSPLPRFESFDNCTLTIRIRREYLRPKNREEITRRRAVWGTEIYTDDSDILAAAIHSGWIRGEWGSDVDASLLDLGLDEPASGAPKQNGDSTPASIPKPRIANPQDSRPITTLPPSPCIPPSEVDLHVTVLILPALKNYAATVRQGVRSRSWGGDHDGKSFKIQSIAWVDEGAERLSERSGLARRKRLKAMADFKRSRQPAEVLGGISRQVNAVGKVAA